MTMASSPSSSSSRHRQPTQSAKGSQRDHGASTGVPELTNIDSSAPTTQQSSEESTASTLVTAAASARERVVSSYHRLCGHAGCNGDEAECEHGILSPRASSAPHDWGDSTDRRSGSQGGRLDSRGGDLLHGVLGDAITDGLLGKGASNGGKNNDEQGIKHTSTTEWLAQRHNVRGKRRMYVQFTEDFLFFHLENTGLQ